MPSMDGRCIATFHKLSDKIYSPKTDQKVNHHQKVLGIHTVMIGYHTILGCFGDQHGQSPTSSEVVESWKILMVQCSE